MNTFQLWNKWKLLLLLLLLFSSCFSTWIWVSQFRLGPSLPLLEDNLWWLVELGLFYRMDVLPATQPSVQKYSREHKALTITSSLASSFLHPQLDYCSKGRCTLYASPKPVSQWSKWTHEKKLHMPLTDCWHLSDDHCISTALLRKMICSSAALNCKRICTHNIHH